LGKPHWVPAKRPTARPKQFGIKTRGDVSRRREVLPKDGAIRLFKFEEILSRKSRNISRIPESHDFIGMLIIAQQPVETNLKQQFVILVTFFWYFRTI
jgi:hypothetical protein